VKALSYLNKYFFTYKKRFLSGFFVVLLSNLFMVLPAPLVRNALDMVIDSATKHNAVGADYLEGAVLDNFTTSLATFVGLIVLVAILRGLFLYLQRKILIGTSRYIEYDLKNEIYDHYQKLPLEFYRKNNTGDLMARISEDVSQVRMYIGPAIMYALNLISLFIIIVPFMISVDARLSLYVLMPLPLLSISIYYVNSKINKRSSEIQKALSRLSTFMQEAFSGIRVIKAYSRENESVNRLIKESNHFRYKSLRLVRVDSFFYPLILLLTGLSTVIIVYFGGLEVISGRITFGVIAEFVIYINLLTWPVASLGWITSLVQRAEASQTRINEFLKTTSTIVSGSITKKMEGRITFSDVSFQYPDTGIQALKNISFDILPGESLAILGGTGSGKSTIANLVCRLYDPNEGQILLDNIDIKEYNTQGIRSNIGYVPQDVFLFSDTISNNIAFGTPEATIEQITKAAAESDLLNNIKDFPQGFETMLGERGITLSGGQKQRVSLARAMIKEPAILILDDSLSAVDTETEHNILTNMKRVMKNRTSIIISHRVSSAKLADKIIVLDGGRIIQSGTHEELSKVKGIYQNLYKKQHEEIL
jgi:ATP-binding cassette subfamily B multidrug efflux pump